jgi:hypothetical protein
LRRHLTPPVTIVANLIPFAVSLLQEPFQTLQLSGDQITVTDFDAQVGDLGLKSFDMTGEHLDVTGEYRCHTRDSDIAPVLFRDGGRDDIGSTRVIGSLSAGLRCRDITHVPD